MTRSRVRPLAGAARPSSARSPASSSASTASGSSRPRPASISSATMLRTIRRRKAFAVTRTSIEVPRCTMRTSVTRRIVRPWAWLPSAPKSRSPRRGRGGAHRTHVQPVVDLERPMPIGQAPFARHPDPVAVHARDRVAPRVESGGRRTERAHHQIRRQQGVEPPPQRRPADLPLAGATRRQKAATWPVACTPASVRAGESDASVRRSVC